MKCIKPTEKSNKTSKVPIRVSNTKAARAVSKGMFQYCPKSEWKAAGRH